MTPLAQELVWRGIHAEPLLVTPDTLGVASAVQDLMTRTGRRAVAAFAQNLLESYVRAAVICKCGVQVIAPADMCGPVAPENRVLPLRRREFGCVRQVLGN